jgi:hypothetical protein
MFLIGKHFPFFGKHFILSKKLGEEHRNNEDGYKERCDLGESNCPRLIFEEFS